MIRVPLSSHANTTQRIELGGVVYALRVRWSERGSCWHLDLADADGAAIVTGMRLTEGFPLLARYRHLSVPAGELVLVDTRDRDGEPTLQDLGERYRLYYFAPGELT